MTEPATPPAPPGAAPRPLDDPATLRSFAARLREGLYVADASGRLLDANAALATLLGASSPAALVGRSLDELVGDPAARRRALAGLDATAGAGGGTARARDVDMELVGLDGVRRAVVESVTVAVGPDGTARLLGVVVPLALAVAEADVAAGDVASADRANGGTGAGHAFAPGVEGVGAARDALTGCLERAHLDALGMRLGRDGTARAGVLVVRLEFGRAALPASAHDTMRQRTARFLMRHVRGDEPIVRLSDDEFLVVLADAHQEQTERVARRVQLLALREAPAPLSLGWATREPGESLAGVVSRAAAARVPVPHGTRGPDGDRRRGEVLGLADALLSRDFERAPRVAR